MALHYVTTHFKYVIISETEYSFLSKQSAMSVRMRVGLLSLNQISEMIWDSESYKAGAPSDTCNQTDQQPEVMHPAVRFLQMPLMKRKFFRVGHVNRSKHHQLHSGHDPLVSWKCSTHL